jgi:hypothetical protein
MKRSRGRNRRSGGNTSNNNHNNPNRHYESVGPDVKIRGSAQQVLEKYQQYARDAHTSGDRVLSEAYFQFAEHYQRIVAKQLEAKDKQQQPQQRGGRDDRDNRRDDRDNRNDGSDDDSNSDNRQEEASVEVMSRSNRNDAADESNTAAETPDSLKVIDGDEVNAADTAPERKAKPAGDRPKTRRKPYRAKEASDASDEPEAATDGVMKTLSRGRRKAVPEASQDASRADDAAETAAD